MILEKWMINNLRNFGNCVVGEDFFRKHGKEKIIAAVKELDYDVIHIKGVRRGSKKKVHAYPGSEQTEFKTTYIIETQIKRKEETHTEEIKMKPKFNIGDKVEIINGTQKGKIGTVESYEKNDNYEYTYGLYIPSLKALVGVVYKQEKDLKLEKKASKKVGRPKKDASDETVKTQKQKKATKVEQLKEVTKEVVEMTEAESTAAVGEPAEVVDELVETVDKAVEVVDIPVETVDEVVEEPKRTYDQLLEAYDVMRRSLNVNELELFSDIVMKDVEASKYVLEQMYQMSIERLIQIRKEFA